MISTNNFPSYEEESDIKGSEKEEKFYLASQSRLIWWKFRRHRLAMIALPLLIFLYLLAIFADFFAPYNPETRFPAYLNVPPTKIHFFSKEDGFHHPFIYNLKRELEPKSFQFTFTEDRTKRYPIRFFVRGESYKLLGLFPTNIHFFGTEGIPVFLFGTEN
jgi:peptide/nickel transport system permease protein